MAGKYENLKHFEYTIADSTAAAVKALWVVPYKIRIYRAQVIQTVTEATICVVKFNLQASAGGASTAGAIAEIAFPAVTKIGYCYYDLVARNMILSPGAAIEIEVTTGSTGNKGLICQLLYDYIPEVETNQTTTMVETA